MFTAFDDAFPYTRHTHTDIWCGRKDLTCLWGIIDQGKSSSEQAFPPQQKSFGSDFP